MGTGGVKMKTLRRLFSLLVVLLVTAGLVIPLVTKALDILPDVAKQTLFGTVPRRLGSVSDVVWPWGLRRDPQGRF
jgi:hypothetical protein